jgi:hypothetical protein
VSGVDDLNAKLEKLLTEAEDCELIGRLAANREKRELFKKLAVKLRSMARDIQAVIATHEPQAVSHKIEDGPMMPKSGH